LVSEDAEFKIDRNWIKCPSTIVPFYYLSVDDGGRSYKFDLDDLTPQIISFLPKNKEVNVKMTVTDITKTMNYAE